MHATKNRAQIPTRELEYLLPEIEGCLSRLLEMEIVYHLRLEQLKLDLEEIEDCNLKRLFRMVDSNRKRYIDQASVNGFLKRMGHLVQPKEVVSIVRRLDIDGDHKISFHEFVEAVSPVSPEIMPPPQRLSEVAAGAYVSFEGPERGPEGGSLAHTGDRNFRVYHPRSLE